MIFIIIFFAWILIGGICWLLMEYLPFRDTIFAQEPEDVEILMMYLFLWPLVLVTEYQIGGFDDVIDKWKEWLNRKR